MKISLLGALLGLTLMSAADAASYTFANKHAALAAQTHALDINRQGAFVSQYYNGSSQKNPLQWKNLRDAHSLTLSAADWIIGSFIDRTGIHGFVYNGSTYTNLHSPSAVATSPVAINERGEVVGSYTYASPHQHGALYGDGSFNTLNFLSATSTDMWDIIKASQIVGSYTDANGIHGFIYNGNTFTNLHMASSLLISPTGERGGGGEAVGSYTYSLHQQGSILSGSGYTSSDVTSAISASLWNLLDSSPITLFNVDTFGSNHDFLFDNSVFSALDISPALKSEGPDTNNNRQTVDTFNLESLVFIVFDGPEGIIDGGQSVKFLFNLEVPTTRFSPTPCFSCTPPNLTETPLPAALPLFVSGVGLLGMVAWRRKRSRKLSLHQ